MKLWPWRRFRGLVPLRMSIAKLPLVVQLFSFCPQHCQDSTVMKVARWRCTYHSFSRFWRIVHFVENSSFTSTPDNIGQHCAFSFSQLNYNLILLQHTFQTYFPQVLAAVKLSLIHTFHFHFLHPNLLLQNIGIGQPEEPVKFVSKMHVHSLEISEGPRNSLHCQMKILQFVLLRPLQSPDHPKTSICISK